MESLNLDLDNDKDRLIVKLATALAWYMDGKEDHDIKSYTGFDDNDCQIIADTRKIAKSIIGWQ